MRNILKVLILTVLFSVMVNAQSEAEAIKKEVNTIFELCKTNKFEAAASKLIYKGNDKDRYMNSTYDYSVRKEKSFVDRVCKKIKSYIKISDKYEFGNFSKKKEEWGESYVQDIVLKSGSQSITTSFVFAKLKNQFLLIDID